MGKNKIESSSQNINDLKKELEKMHKQFDNLTVKESASIDNSNNLIDSDLTSVESNYDKDKLNNSVDQLIDDAKDNKNEELISESEINEVEKTSINTSNDDIKINGDDLNESYLNIKDKLVKIKSDIENTSTKPDTKITIESKISEVALKSEDTFVENDESEAFIEITEIINGDDINESDLSVSDEIERIKSEIKENDKKLSKLDEKKSTDVDLKITKKTTVTKSETTNNTTTSNTLTNIILTLIAAIIFCFYYIFIY